MIQLKDFVFDGHLEPKRCDTVERNGINTQQQETTKKQQ